MNELTDIVTGLCPNNDPAIPKTVIAIGETLIAPSCAAMRACL
jgi:hypothetical protein